MEVCRERQTAKCGGGGSVCESLFCVDPGSEGTGWAYWKNIKIIKPSQTGVHKATREKEWKNKIDKIANEVDAFLDDNPCNIGIVEFPEFWKGSKRSLASAHTGSLVKLCVLTGVLYEVIQRYSYETLFVKPREWKGNLPKDVVDLRIYEAIGKRYKNHVSDAVGIGLNHITGDL
jgi:Holliday junction resolvasome RuvABC endonuclease subunit